MKCRSKFLMLSLAALAGFLVSRPDIRKKLPQILEEYKEAAAKKEEELTEEVKE